MFVIGQDFGAMVAYKFVLEHPERVLGVATLGVPFMPPGPFTSHNTLPEGFYVIFSFVTQTRNYALASVI